MNAIVRVICRTKQIRLESRETIVKRKFFNFACRRISCRIFSPPVNCALSGISI
jgi:hypothetical protein